MYFLFIHTYIVDIYSFPVSTLAETRQVGV